MGNRIEQQWSRCPVKLLVYLILQVWSTLSCLASATAAAGSHSSPFCITFGPQPPPGRVQASSRSAAGRMSVFGTVYYLATKHVRDKRGAKGGGSAPIIPRTNGTAHAQRQHHQERAEVPLDLGEDPRLQLVLRAGAPEIAALYSNDSGYYSELDEKRIEIYPERVSKKPDRDFYSEAFIAESGGARNDSGSTDDSGGAPRYYKQLSGGGEHNDRDSFWGKEQGSAENSDSERYLLQTKECFDGWYREPEEWRPWIKKRQYKVVYEYPFDFSFQGKFLGRTHMRIHVQAFWPGSESIRQRGSGKKHRGGDLGSGSSSLERSFEYMVVVLREKSKAFLNHIFIGVLTILVIIANLLMGCKLQLDVVWQVIKKPIAPLIGIMCQFVFMPLFSYGLARLIFTGRGMLIMGLGLFTTGCSPGGGASNFWTLLLDGNIDLSVTMTFLSTLCAIGTMPFWMFFLGQYFLSESAGEIVIPYKNIMISLTVLILPLLIGVAIRQFLPKAATVMLKALRPFLVLIILFICVFGTYANLYMLRLMSWQVLLASLVVPWAGMLFGLGTAIFARQERNNIVAIAVETGVQNTGIAIMLLKMSFGQPDADLSSVVPVVVAVFTPVPLLMALICHCWHNWRKAGTKGSALEVSSSGTGGAVATLTTTGHAAGLVACGCGGGVRGEGYEAAHQMKRGVLSGHNDGSGVEGGKQTVGCSGAACSGNAKTTMPKCCCNSDSSAASGVLSRMRAMYKRYRHRAPSGHNVHIDKRLSNDGFGDGKSVSSVQCCAGQAGRRCGDSGASDSLLGESSLRDPHVEACTALNGNGIVAPKAQLSRAFYSGNRYSCTNSTSQKATTHDEAGQGFEVDAVAACNSGGALDRMQQCYASLMNGNQKSSGSTTFGQDASSEPLRDSYFDKEMMPIAREQATRMEQNKQRLSQSQPELLRAADPESVTVNFCGSGSSGDCGQSQVGL
jgi:sodium/bile acid cotransporter 3/5